MPPRQRDQQPPDDDPGGVFELSRRLLAAVAADDRERFRGLLVSGHAHVRGVVIEWARLLSLTGQTGAETLARQMPAADHPAYPGLQAGARLVDLAAATPTAAPDQAAEQARTEARRLSGPDLWLLAWRLGRHVDDLLALAGEAEHLEEITQAHLRVAAPGSSQETVARRAALVVAVLSTGNYPLGHRWLLLGLARRPQDTVPLLQLWLSMVAELAEQDPRHALVLDWSGTPSSVLDVGSLAHRVPEPGGELGADPLDGGGPGEVEAPVVPGDDADLSPDPHTGLTPLAVRTLVWATDAVTELSAGDRTVLDQAAALPAPDQTALAWLLSVTLSTRA